jgi:hypothetical protein
MADAMSPADVHQILIPYLYAGAAMMLIVLIAAALLKRDGAKRKYEAECAKGARYTDALSNY